MADEFRLRVLTPMGEVLKARATYLRVTAWDGDLGVMAGHAPMVERISIGAMQVTGRGGQKRWFATVDGVMRVKHDEVVLIVGAAEESAEIDVERAQTALERARHRLASREGEVDISRAELALARAANRLKVVERSER